MDGGLNTLPANKDQAKQLAHLQSADSAFWAFGANILQLGPADDSPP